MQRTREFFERRAELYDLAFSWDVEEEVDWLVARLRLGRERPRLLEPACGSGRMLEAFARRGFRTSGLDLSRSMLALARVRLTGVGVGAPDLHRVDIADFELGRRFDAAICPVSSLGYLPDFASVARHLGAMARHLEPGARYLVQLELNALDGYRPTPVSEHSCWQRETSRGALRTSWFGRDWDAARRIETQVSRFEFTSGPEAGSTVEEPHEMRIWCFEEWARLLEAAPFTWLASYDGSRAERPPLEIAPSLERHTLLWHELRLE
jgi:SAM-dependent methyltransferase